MTALTSETTKVHSTFTMFWGCLIPNKLPFLEKSIRQAFSHFNTTIKDLDGASCCPDPTYSRMQGEKFWLPLAARNLALAESIGPELITSCNGCYNTLRGACGLLNSHERRTDINERLSNVNLRYNGNVSVSLLPQVFQDTITVESIKRKVKKSLRGLRAATFLGCHATNPPQIAVDSDSSPKILDRLVEAIDAESVEYPEKYICCGGPGTALEDDVARELLRRKLQYMRDAEVDCIVVTCPTCFMQFDRIGGELFRELRLPVFHYTELLNVALGDDPSTLGFDWHRVPVEPALQRIGLGYSELEEIKSNFNYDLLKQCCRGCTYDCSAAISSWSGNKSVFDPLETVDRLVQGRLTEALENPDIWRCINCHQCTFWCPHGMGLEEVFSKLRELARKRGISPDIVKTKIDILTRTGLGLQKISEEIREDLDLEPLEPPPPGLVNKLFASEKHVARST
ncbi:MAG: heterodisulfide reductase-related iron-sulfur binding cluster [Candidatus Ranarchaeia archaeon]